MGEFFESKRFKILLAVFALLFTFFLRSVYTGGFMPFVSRLGDVLIAPVSKVTTSFSNSIQDNLYPFLHARELMAENEVLKEENRQLENQLIDYQSLKNENEQFREFLEIKEENQTLIFQPATVIGRSPDSHFGSFTIDKGSYHGISPRDAVITSDGLVGIVSEVSYTYANVQTILDVSVSVGGVDIYTLDTGVVGGSMILSSQNLCRLSFLPRESGVAPGDIVNTSGVGGLMPQGLKIGTIQSVETEASGLSVYAVVKPSADIQGAKTVQVITGYGAKGD